MGLGGHVAVLGRRAIDPDKPRRQHSGLGWGGRRTGSGSAGIRCARARVGTSGDPARSARAACSGPAAARGSTRSGVGPAGRVGRAARPASRRACAGVGSPGRTRGTRGARCSAVPVVGGRARARLGWLDRRSFTRAAASHLGLGCSRRPSPGRGAVMGAARRPGWLGRRCRRRSGRAVLGSSACRTSSGSGWLGPGLRARRRAGRARGRLALRASASAPCSCGSPSGRAACARC